MIVPYYGSQFRYYGNAIIIVIILMSQASVGSVGEFWCSDGTSHHFGAISVSIHTLELQKFNFGERNIGGLANICHRKEENNKIEVLGDTRPHFCLIISFADYSISKGKIK